MFVCAVHVLENATVLDFKLKVIENIEYIYVRDYSMCMQIDTGCSVMEQLDTLRLLLIAGTNFSEFSGNQQKR